MLAPVEVFVNCTVIGMQPCVELAEKEATNEAEALLFQAIIISTSANDNAERYFLFGVLVCMV